MKPTNMPTRKNASHSRDENHRPIASHERLENHARHASQVDDGTQERVANLQGTYYRIEADNFRSLQKARIEISNRMKALERVRDVSADTILPVRLDEEMKKLEERTRAAFPRILSGTKVYDGFLKDIRGIGPTHSMMLIGILRDMRRFESVSSLWHYCGLHVIDGHAAASAVGKKNDWNPDMKRLSYLISESFVRGGGFYRLKYDEWKPQETKKHAENGCKAKDKCPEKLHVERRVRRRVVKLFLSHVYAAWRELEGLPVREPWIIGREGHKDYIDWKEALAFDSKTIEPPTS